MWYVVTDRANPRDCVTLPGGVVAWWVRVRLQSGTVTWGAQFDESRCTDVPGLRRIPGRSVVDDAHVAVLQQQADRQADRQADAEVRPATITSQVLVLALRQGWALEDLAGAGDGDPGELGGRAAVSGLTLAEAALSMPPIDWPELRADKRKPWESTAWRIASPGWRPPHTPPLAPPPKRVVDGTIPAPVFDATATAPGAEADEEDTGDGTSLEELLSSPMDPSHVLYDYPRDGLAALVTLVRELARAKGAAPHRTP